METPQAETREQLVAGEAQLFQDADCHLLAELQPFNTVRASVQAGDVAAQSDVARQLVEFATDGEVRPPFHG